MRKRSSIQIMVDTVHALMMREIKTRFGSNRLGYFWALAEPIGQVAILGLIFSLMGRSSVANIPIALFLFTGKLPFSLFTKLLTQITAAVESNKGLLSYRQVSAIDPVITRVLIEVATYLVVYLIIFAFMAWLGFEVLPDDLLGVLAASGLLIIFSVGIGLIFCTAASYWKDTSKLVGMITMPMFFVSGIFFCATSIPPQYLYLFDWNPVFHAIELGRDASFSAYTTPIGSWLYLSLLALVSFSLGLAMFHLSRMRFLIT
ncbi:ABC transporter permease [Shewanella violacea]|uniref:Transport permease protein n=1 Tax=Shewanella violacea (strain JCM 10179 / CIP 106290 / LMG 19151 / DSS12) TaxID=637905 RepID=D4ZFY5_SHEVD|nr:ABC transporter permease [Shewanella violacea]BAJ00584.1 polysialic acid transport protein KpsM [Shewanella violacea DSS12]